MHASSFENMEKCYRKYIAGGVLEKKAALKILDVGGANVNGNYSDIFKADNIEYLGADIQPGEGVSIILEDPNTLPLEDNSIDIVISGQMLEHCPFFWMVFSEMVRVLNNSGFIFLIAPSAGPIHNYPVDCYRFYPDSYRALAKHANCYLIDLWHDNRGPWNDLVGVFNKSGVKPNNAPIGAPDIVVAANIKATIKETPYEKIQGTTHYLDVLKRLHNSLKPNNYLEIGVRNGRSLSLATGNAIGVDPMSDIVMTLPGSTRVIEKTSDDFFEEPLDPILKLKPELVFIDGMHLFEYALRDFMNVELHSGPDTIIAIDDIFPNEPEQATRERKTKVWTGDVWKLYCCLTRYRPDLCMIPLDTSPTGLLLITGLNANNRTLWQHYNPIVRQIRHSLETPTAEILNRKDAISPSGQAFQKCLDIINTAKDNQESLATHKHALIAASYPIESLPNKSVTPKLSIVVVAYNMARELPRTLKSLSPAMQSGLIQDDYEIIVVDNASSNPFDLAQCQSICSNIKFVYNDTDSVSPAGAINIGIAQAQGDLVCVMIDGARMASPGLLATALDAARTHLNAVIGTLAFHLGNSVQMKSVKEGYNQLIEDQLLKTIPWENDGYKLFDISVYAGSSNKGWFSVPNETNALFMRKSLWQKLGGYEEKFQQPGGGMVNLDTWYRACHHPDAHVIMLLGEATFHQFHGGVATNALESNVEAYHKEYKEIRGHQQQRPDVEVTHFGNKQPNLETVILNSTPERSADNISKPLIEKSTQERPFSSEIPASVLSEIQQGVMKSVYKGVPFFKSPFDIGIYLQLIAKQKPKCVIEIGTKHGGSALWFADMLSALREDTPLIVTIDIEMIAKFKDNRILFLQGDAADLGAVLEETFLRQLPKPLLVIEDSSHQYQHSIACLRFFHPFMQSGDYIIIEDGIVSQLPELKYRGYKDGPNRAVAEFLTEYGNDYAIDTKLCDHYGMNYTYNPNGYLKRL